MPGSLVMLYRFAILIVMLWLTSCATQTTHVERRPAAEVQSQIVLLMPQTVRDSNDWAADIQVAFDHLGIETDKSHLCAALAVIAQESGFEADPKVPGQCAPNAS